jgi:type IV pilus assembly protein PilV
MTRRNQQGVTLIEVLVSIIIVVIGLLGLAGLQARATLGELEALQRAQALVLLQDMVDRISANRKAAMEYATATVWGTPQGALDCSTLTGSALDMCEWSNALNGAAESSGGVNTGAMIGARGCIVNTVPAMPRQFVVSVVWQGTAATVAPTTTCGQGQYGNDALRRGLTATVIIGCLQNTAPGVATCVTP